MKLKNIFNMLFLLVLFLVIACKQPTDNSDPEFTIVTKSESLGDIPQDVYFIFTNSSTTETTTVAPDVNSSIRILDAKTVQEKSDSIMTVNSSDDSGILQEIREFESQSLFLSGSNSRAITTPQDPHLNFTDIPGTSKLDFIISTSGATIAATNRFFESIGTVTLSIWVADDCWSGDPDVDTSNPVDQPMVEALADEFLLSGSANDIYDRVTNIFGVPWGSHTINSLLPDTAADHITILLYDIEDDDIVYKSNGATYGFFWSKDNFKKTSYINSNERVMFYIDSVIYADGDDDANWVDTPTDNSVWASSDPMPQSIFSTLAHEYQHMIHFYQKKIKNDVDYSDTWLNEMCSLVAEDLIASIQGYDNPSSSRLPKFNEWAENSFLNWQLLTPSSTADDMDMLLRDYSSAYAFGAFLARNYGGADLFQKIVQNPYIDESAIVNAVNSVSNGVNNATFESLLIAWGKAVLNSEDTSFSPGYNSIGTIDSTIGSITYQLDGINLNDYNTPYGTGPFFYDQNWVVPTIGPGSNLYFKAGSDLTGEQSWDITLPAGVTVTTVLK